MFQLTSVKHLHPDWPLHFYMQNTSTRHYSTIHLQDVINLIKQSEKLKREKLISCNVTL